MFSLRSYMSHRWAQRRSDECGFSLLELVAVVAIMAIFGIAISTGLQSFTTTTTSTQNKNFALADTRIAIEAIARDLRAANPIEAIANAVVDGNDVTYANRISFTVYCSRVGDNGCSSTNARRVVYQFLPHKNELVQTVGTRSRSLLRPRGGLNAVPQAQRPGALVNTVDQPVFTYMTKSGVVLKPSTSTFTGAPATSFRNCTKTVKIHLVVVADPRRPDTAVNLTTTVDLRNSNEVTNCP